MNKVIFLLLIALTANFISCQKKSQDIKTNIEKTQEQQNLQNTKTNIEKPQIEKSQEQRYLQNRQYLLEREINNFFNKVEQAGDNVAGRLVVSFKEKGEKISKTTNQKLHKEELNDFFNKVEQTGDNIAGELVIRSEKLTDSIILDTLRLPSFTLYTINVYQHGSSSCAYCTHIGGSTCVFHFIKVVPYDAEEVTVKISKKDKHGCRTVTVYW